MREFFFDFSCFLFLSGACLMGKLRSDWQWRSYSGNVILLIVAIFCRVKSTVHCFKLWRKVNSCSVPQWWTCFGSFDKNRKRCLLSFFLPAWFKDLFFSSTPSHAFSFFPLFLFFSPLLLVIFGKVIHF